MCYPRYLLRERQKDESGRNIVMRGILTRRSDLRKMFMQSCYYCLFKGATGPTAYKVYFMSEFWLVRVKVDEGEGGSS